jgi:hypothetical protein
MTDRYRRFKTPAPRRRPREASGSGLRRSPWRKSPSPWPREPASARRPSPHSPFAGNTARDRQSRQVGFDRWPENAAEFVAEFIAATSGTSSRWHFAATVNWLSPSRNRPGGCASTWWWCLAYSTARSAFHDLLPRPRILPRACSDTTEYFWRDPACIGHRGDRSSALTRPRRSRRTLCIEPQLDRLTVRS